jgi:hypothetical protein
MAGRLFRVKTTTHSVAMSIRRPEERTLLRVCFAIHSGSILEEISCRLLAAHVGRGGNFAMHWKAR